MSCSVRLDLSIDPTERFRVHLHPDGIATTVILGASHPRTELSFDHFYGEGHSPAASITWLRSVADAMEVAWAQRRLAESQPELTEVAS